MLVWCVVCGQGLTDGRAVARCPEVQMAGGGMCRGEKKMRHLIEVRALDADKLDNFEAVARADAPQHPVNMILDGLLGEIQFGGDFLVGFALRNQWHKLLLTAR